MPAVLPSIRPLPLSDEAKSLFSRAVQIVQRSPDAFRGFSEWWDEHYSEKSLRARCEQRYRRDTALQLRDLRRASPVYLRRLAICRGRESSELMQERIREAQLRGQRLDGKKVVTRSHPEKFPDEQVIGKSNVKQVWKWEDAQYRQQRKRIKEERKEKMYRGDKPEDISWRLRRALRELVNAEYPILERRFEHSCRVVAMAGVLMPECLAVLGEPSRTPFESVLDLPVTPTGEWLGDLFAENAREASRGPHGYQPTMIDFRNVGRQEALFARLPGEHLKLRHDIDLDDFLTILAIALDELESVAPPLDLPSLKGAAPFATGTPLQTGAGETPKYSFRLSGNVWEIHFDGEHGLFSNNLKGFGILAKLLRFQNPSKPMTAAELLGRDSPDASGEHTWQESADPVAIAAARKWLADDYPKNLEAARESGNTKEIDDLDEEKVHIEAYLKMANGFGGNARPIGAKSPAESARSSVKTNINRALKRLREANPPLTRLAEHIDASIKAEGTSYAYRSQLKIDWML